MFGKFLQILTGYVDNNERWGDKCSTFPLTSPTWCCLFCSGRILHTLHLGIFNTTHRKELSWTNNCMRLCLPGPEKLLMRWYFSALTVLIQLKLPDHSHHDCSVLWIHCVALASAAEKVGPVTQLCSSCVTFELCLVPNKWKQMFPNAFNVVFLSSLYWTVTPKFECELNRDVCFHLHLYQCSLLMYNNNPPFHRAPTHFSLLLYNKKNRFKCTPFTFL